MARPPLISLLLLGALALVAVACEAGDGATADGDVGTRPDVLADTATSDAVDAADSLVPRADAGADVPDDAARIDTIDVAETSDGAGPDAGPALDVGPAFDAGPALDVGPAFDAGPAGTVRVDRGTQRYFTLPVGSLRHAVSGWSGEAGLCVSLIWDFSNTGHATGAWCDEFGPSFPYVLLRESTRNDCDDWDYGSDIQVVAAEGCVDFATATLQGSNLVDVRVDVRTDALHPLGARDLEIVMDDRDLRYPVPVSLGLVPADGADPAGIAVREVAEDGRPGWVRVLPPEEEETPGGVDTTAFDRCDVPRCGSDAPFACDRVQARTRTLGERGGAIWATWDGRWRRWDPEAECVRLVYAESGRYRAEFCHGAPAGDDPPVAPACHTVRFDYPTDRVTLEVDAP